MQDASNSIPTTALESFRPDTVRAVLDTVREEYLAQERRHNLLVSKTQTLATVAALFFTVTAASGEIKLTHGVFRWVSSLGYGLAVIGVAICIFVLRSKVFHKVRYAPALDDRELKKPPEIVMVNLAKTYDEAITKSEKSYDALVHLFDRATIILLVSVVLGGIAVFSASFGGHSMSNEKPKTQTQTQTQTTAPQPSSSPQTGSYGTDISKRSQDPAKTGSYGTKQLRENDGKRKR